ARCCSYRVAKAPRSPVTAAWRNDASLEASAGRTRLSVFMPHTPTRPLEQDFNRHLEPCRHSHRQFEAGHALARSNSEHRGAMDAMERRLGCDVVSTFLGCEGIVDVQPQPNGDVVSRRLVV